MKTKKDWALYYAQRGFRVFPLIDRGKTPRTKGWQEQASNSPKKVEEYWSQFPSANIGIATGKISGIFILDVDGTLGFESLQILMSQHGCLPTTIEVDTGSGGKHYYFSWPQNVEIRNSAGKIGAGLDIRGNGGYVVAPPSIHPNGNTYEWSVLSGDNLAPAPQWLINLIVKDKLEKTTKNRNASPPSSEWKKLVKEIPSGQRNDSIARIAGKLLRTGIDPHTTLILSLALNRYSCKPPLLENEIHQIVESICKKEFQRLGGQT